MKKEYSLPDYLDRSQNEPLALVSPTQVFGLYAQIMGITNNMRLYKPMVQDWYCAYAIQNGWADAWFTGDQCILSILSRD